MFHTVVQRGFQQRGRMSYLFCGFIVVSIPTVKEFSKSVNSW